MFCATAEPAKAEPTVDDAPALVPVDKTPAQKAPSLLPVAPVVAPIVQKPASAEPVVPAKKGITHPVKKPVQNEPKPKGEFVAP